MRNIIAVTIPCFKVTDKIEGVIARIGPEVSRIYCVDDGCPDGSGDYIERNIHDPRVVVLRNQRNMGVGGATLAGFQRAVDDGADVVVKVDGDGQMDAELIELFVRPILAGRADYAKGNRFFHPSSVRGMPLHRIIGNAALSFLTKLSSGYWNIFDPTNGYIAIHRSVLSRLRLEHVSRRYFFESDMLFHLNIAGAVVEDVPMDAVYGDEKSHLVARRLLFEFLFKNLRNFVRRIAYNYYLRNFTIGSLEIILGSALLSFGTCFGITKWSETWRTQSPVTAGTVMLAALPTILGVQLLLSFLNSDMSSMPSVPLHKRLERPAPAPERP